MQNSKKKRFGISALIASLIIGLGIGASGGYILGQKQSVSTGPDIQESQETGNIEIQETVRYTENAGSEETDFEHSMGGNFSVDDEEALTINGTVIFLSEINARAYMARDEYVVQYGEEPWGMALEDGQTVAEYAKNTMLREMQRVTILADQAEVYGVDSLTEEELARCKGQTDDYMASLGRDVAAQFSVEYNAVQTIYKKDALAMKVYNKILSDLTDSLRAQAEYSGMDDNALEAVVRDQFEQLYSQWREESVIDTTESWNQLRIGAMG